MPQAHPPQYGTENSQMPPSVVKPPENSEVQQMSTDSLQNNATLELKRAIDLRNKGEYEESLNVLNLVIQSHLKTCNCVNPWCV